MAKRKLIKKAAKSVAESAKKKAVKKEEYSWDKVLSTGSTLLDLAISSGRIHGGGVPGSILMEVYGPSGAGKTSILSELCGSAQHNGGAIKFLDPEARLDAEYNRIYGVELDKEHYHRPDTVEEMFDLLTKWNPNDKHINVLAADSLAALSTDLELEKGDKMGMRRAKLLSEGLRKTARLIGKRNQIIACSNQLRQGDFGKTTPGGMAVGYYASLRIEMRNAGKIEQKKKISSGATVSRIIGIKSICKITKSSIDRPFREVPIYIVFDLGIDDVRGNLQWLKDMKKGTKYQCIDKEYMYMTDAINYIEGNNMEYELREEVISIWNEIETKFANKRSKQRR